MTSSLTDAETLLQGPTGPRAILAMRGDLPEDAEVDSANPHPYLRLAAPPLRVAGDWNTGTADDDDDEYRWASLGQMCVRPSKRIWFCNSFYHITGQDAHDPTQDVVDRKSLSLKLAQRHLGVGTVSSPRAIIPMRGFVAGDPHYLPKKWAGGEMWWMGWDQINPMRNACEREAKAHGVADKL